MNRYPVTPRRAVAGLVENVNDDVFVAALLVAIGGVQREGEVVDGVGVESDTFASWRCAACVRRAACDVVIALVLDRNARIGVCLLPAGISFHWYSCRSDDLVSWQVYGDIVTPEFPVELTGWIERMILPAVAIVHDDFRIPLCEIEAPALPPLAPLQRRA